MNGGRPVEIAFWDVIYIYIAKEGKLEDGSSEMGN